MSFLALPRLTSPRLSSSPLPSAHLASLRLPTPRLPSAPLSNYQFTLFFFIQPIFPADIDLTDVTSVADPMSKVEAGLKGSGDQPVPLQAVHVRAKLLDLVAQVKTRTTFMVHRLWTVPLFRPDSVSACPLGFLWTREGWSEKAHPQDSQRTLASKSGGKSRTILSLMVHDAKAILFDYCSLIYFSFSSSKLFSYPRLLYYNLTRTTALFLSRQSTSFP